MSVSLKYSREGWQPPRTMPNGLRWNPSFVKFYPFGMKELRRILIRYDVSGSAPSFTATWNLTWIYCYDQKDRLGLWKIPTWAGVPLSLHCCGQSLSGHSAKTDRTTSRFWTAGFVPKARLQRRNKDMGRTLPKENNAVPRILNCDDQLQFMPSWTLPNAGVVSTRLPIQTVNHLIANHRSGVKRT